MTAGIGPVEKYKCKKCGHTCHCDKPDCPSCVNDVCTVCECQKEESLPRSFLSPTNTS
jgi:lipopolysaccharide biosynthesis regulator YciM